MQLQVRGGARRTTAALSLLIPASSPLFPPRSSPVTSRYLPPSLPPSLGASRQASVPPPPPFFRRPRTAPSPPPSASHQVSSALSAVGCAPLQGGLRGSSLVRQARPRRSRLCRGALAARLAALPPLSHSPPHSSHLRHAAASPPHRPLSPSLRAPHLAISPSLPPSLSRSLSAGLCPSAPPLPPPTAHRAIPAAVGLTPGLIGALCRRLRAAAGRAARLVARA